MYQDGFAFVKWCLERRPIRSTEVRVSLTLSQKPYLTPPGVHDPGLDPGQHGLPMEEVEGILRKQNRGAILELPHGCGLRNARTPIPVG